MSVVGYDVAGLRLLRQRTIEALDALTRLRLDDRHAAGAAQVIGEARRLLEHGWLASIDRILREDPLNAAGGAQRATRAVEASTTSAEAVVSAYDGRHRDLDDLEFLAALRDLQIEHGAVNGARGPFWHDEFPHDAHEIADRLSTSSSFVALVDDRPELMPIVALTLAHHPLDDEHTMWIAHTVLATHQPARPTLAPISDVAVEVVLRRLAESPTLALEVLGTDHAIADVLAHEWTDREVAGEAISAAFAAADGTRRSDERLAAMLRGAADAAGGARDRAGLPSPIARSLASGLATLAPILGRTSEDTAAWIATAADPSAKTRVTAEELDDLVGALLRDPTAGAALFAAGFGLTAQATHQWIDLPPDRRTVERGDADGFAAILERAAANEQLEDEAARAADVAFIGYVFDGIEFAAERATASASPVVGEVTERLVDAGEALAAGTITVDAIEAGGFAGRFDEVERVEIVRNLLDDPAAARNDAEAGHVAGLRDALATFDDAVRVARTEPVDLHELVVTLEQGYRGLDPSPRLHPPDVFDVVAGNDR